MEIEKGDLQQESVNVKWTIEKFFTDCRKVGDCYYSPEFDVPYDNDITKWYLCVYPKGRSEERKDYVVLYLCLDDNYEGLVLTADFQLSFVSKNNSTSLKYHYTHEFNDIDENWHWGITDSVGQHFINDPKNGFLIDDTVTITCVLSIHQPDQDGAKNFSGYNEWLNKITNGFEDYEQLLDEANFSDVTFNVQNKQIKTHKNILTCRSPVFKAMFQHQMRENKESVVDITDINHDVMTELFRFLYSGKVKNIENIAGDLMIAADKYQVTGLKALCEKTLYDKLTVDNAIEYLKLTDMCDTIHLKRLVINFVAIHHKELVKTPGFIDLSKDVMYKVMLAVSERE